MWYYHPTQSPSRHYNVYAYICHYCDFCGQVVNVGLFECQEREERRCEKLDTCKWTETKKKESKRPQQTNTIMGE